MTPLSRLYNNNDGKSCFLLSDILNFSGLSIRAKKMQATKRSGDDAKQRLDETLTELKTDASRGLQPYIASTVLLRIELDMPAMFDGIGRFIQQ
jgi:hypothetical protein